MLYEINVNLLGGISCPEKSYFKIEFFFNLKIILFNLINFFTLTKIEKKVI